MARRQRSRAKLTDADLVDATFIGVDIRDARLSGTTLTDTVFDGCRRGPARGGAR